MINLHPTKTRRQGKRRSLLNLEMKHKLLREEENIDELRNEA